jgi:hypothetical protein
MDYFCRRLTSLAAERNLKQGEVHHAIINWKMGFGHQREDKLTAMPPHLLDNKSTNNQLSKILNNLHFNSPIHPLKNAPC